MGKSVKTDKEEAATGNIDKKRLEYLEMASIVNTILEKRYFEQVTEAMKKSSYDDFARICESAKIPSRTWKILWDTLQKAHTESLKDNPWLC